MSLCPHPNECGSCGWSHIPYKKQLAQKLSDINGSFKLKKLSHRVEEIFPSPKTEHYRNRMDFVIDFEGRVGLREKGKWWKVIDDHTCFLADEQIEALFPLVRTWAKNAGLPAEASAKAGLSFYDRKAFTGLLRYAVIRATSTGETMIMIITSTPQNVDEEKRVRDAIRSLAQTCASSSIIWSINETQTDISIGTRLETISGNDWIEEVIEGLRYRITPNAFFQTNSAGAAILLRTVSDFAGELKNKTLLDLYCGSGFFSIPLSQDAKRIVGVESVADAVRDAKVNAEINHSSATFELAETEKFDWSVYNADTVILDPPRSGMHDRALADVLRIRPQTIVYVSCNYKNFAREMVQLESAYRLTSIRAIDMFPHTPHVELVSRLSARGGSAFGGDLH